MHCLACTCALSCACYYSLFLVASAGKHACLLQLESIFFHDLGENQFSWFVYEILFEEVSRSQWKKIYSNILQINLRPKNGTRGCLSTGYLIAKWTKQFCSGEGIDFDFYWYFRSLMRHLCLVHQILMNWCCTPSIGWYIYVNQTGIRLGKRVWIYKMWSHFLRYFFIVFFYGFLFRPLN